MENNEIDLSETNGASLISVVVVLLTLSWISVVLRTYTRAVLMKGFQWDDWIMLLAQGIFTVYCSFLFKGVERGIGRHNAALPSDAVVVVALKWQALAIGTYIILMCFVKLSIGVFLLRLAAAQKVYTWILRISIFVVTVWSLTIFFWNIFQCSPVDKQWDYRITGGSCVPPAEIVSAAYAMTALTILSDWLFALLPIPMLWNVKMSKQAKITVILILSLGIFASVATLVRIRFLPDMANTDDILYAGTNAMIWTIVEAGLAIVASSLATIRPLLRAMRIRGFEPTEQNTGQSKRSFQPASSSSRPPQLPRILTGGGADAAYGLDDLLQASTENIHQPGKEVSGRQGGGATTTTTVEMTSARGRGGGGGGPEGNRNGNMNTVTVTGESDKSEMYVIEGVEVPGPGTGTGPPSTWSGSSNTSLDQIHDLEAQSQENPRFGIGSDSQR